MNDEEVFRHDHDDDFIPYPDEPSLGNGGPTDASARVVDDDDS